MWPIPAALPLLHKIADLCMKQMGMPMMGQAIIPDTPDNIEWNQENQ